LADRRLAGEMGDEIRAEFLNGLVERLRVEEIAVELRPGGIDGAVRPRKRQYGAPRVRVIRRQSGREMRAHETRPASHQNAFVSGHRGRRAFFYCLGSLNPSPRLRRSRSASTISR